MKLGFIYLLSNPAMPGLIKVGSTSKVPDGRAAELSDPTGVPQPFVIEYWCLTRDPVSVEATIHNVLVKHRVNGSREFFRITLDEAIKATDKAVSAVPARFVRAPLSQTPDCKGGDVRECSRCGMRISGASCWSCGKWLGLK